MAGFRSGLAPALIRFRSWIALTWLAVFAALLSFAGRAEETLEVAARIHGSESAAVERVLAEEFASPFAYYAILVLSGVPAPDGPEGQQLLDQTLTVLTEVPGVAGTFSYLDVPDTLFLGSGGSGTFAVVGFDPESDPVDVLVPRLRAATASLTPRLQARFPDAALRWTGEAALNFDLRQTSAEQARGAEKRVLPATAVLLLLAFGAVAAALLPIITGVVAIPITLGASVLLAERWPLSILLVNVVSMIGLGLGIDYGLLTVSRFRESLTAGRTARAAAVDAARHAGHTVMVSGAAVALGFAALVLVPLNEIRSVAIGGLLVAAVSALLATTLLPGLLAWLGTRVDAGQLWRRSPRHTAHGWWRRWGYWVAARPKRVLVVAGTPVLILSLQALRLSTELPRGDWLPPSMESAAALHDLEAMGHGGVVQTLRLVLELPQGVAALHSDGWTATLRLSEQLAADPRIARVQSFPTLLGGATLTPQIAALLPQDLLRSFISLDQQSVLLEILPEEDVAPNELSRLVRELRNQDAGALTGLSGARLQVGGLPALNADYEDTVAGRFPAVLALVLGGTLLALFIGFRSVLIPLKAILLNLISVAAAFGAVVLVFQDGYGAAWLGLPGPTEGVFPAVPILVFCTVFGLSMDYEIFLVDRVAEARRSGMDETDALAEGLARTGGVITSAAVIMIAVFGAFTLGDFLLIKMLGFALAVAVFVDATVVRLAIGPALLRLAGEWNWWPGGVDPVAVAGQHTTEEAERKMEMAGFTPS
jgi:RND superfamily putative drug exporter